MTLEECYDKHKRLLTHIIVKDYSNLLAYYSLEDLQGEAALKLVEVYHRYPALRDKPVFRPLLSRSIHCAMLNLYDSGKTRSRREFAVGEFHEGSLGVDFSLEDEALYNVMEPGFFRRVQEELRENIGEHGVELFKHMLWSKEVIAQQRKVYLRKKHVISKGIKTQMKGTATGSSGVVSLLVLSAVMGISPSAVAALRLRVRKIVRRLWGELAHVG